MAAEGFIAWLELEVSAMAHVDAQWHQAGGFYALVGRDGAVAEEYPSVASGVRPLDGADDFVD